MHITYFAHEGVEHANAMEAGAHDSTDHKLLFFVITALVVLAALAAVKLLSREAKK